MAVSDQCLPVGVEIGKDELLLTVLDFAGQKVYRCRDHAIANDWRVGRHGHRLLLSDKHVYLLMFALNKPSAEVTAEVQFWLRSLQVSCI